jgi:hypothetical protein
VNKEPSPPDPVAALRVISAFDWLDEGHFQVLAAAIDRTVHDDLCPSDHYPITAVLRPVHRIRDMTCALVAAPPPNLTQSPLPAGIGPRFSIHAPLAAAPVSPARELVSVKAMEQAKGHFEPRTGESRADDDGEETCGAAAASGAGEDPPPLIPAQCRPQSPPVRGMASAPWLREPGAPDQATYRYLDYTGDQPRDPRRWQSDSAVPLLLLIAATAAIFVAALPFLMP